MVSEVSEAVDIDYDDSHVATGAPSAAYMSRGRPKGCKTMHMHEGRKK